VYWLLVALNITVLSHAQIWYALASKNSNIVSNNFLAFLLANPSMAMSKFISSVNYCSTDSMARFLNRKVLILDLKRFLISLSFEKHLSQAAALKAIVRTIRSIITIFETEFQRLYFWKNCQSVFLYCELYIGNMVWLWCNNNVLRNCTTMNKRRNNYQYFFCY